MTTSRFNQVEELREALLPKLLSGDVRVSAVAEAMADGKATR
jgi:hypothetical protein